MCTPGLNVANDRPVNSCKQSEVQKRERKAGGKKNLVAGSNDPSLIWTSTRESVSLTLCQDTRDDVQTFSQNSHENCKTLMNPSCAIVF